MSQENVEVVRHFFEAFGRGDLDATLDYIAPDFEFHRAAWLSKIESGMFVHSRAFAEWNEALEAAGLSE